MRKCIFLLLCKPIVTCAHVEICEPRNYGFGSTVCVCNATYCDSVPDWGSPSPGTFHWCTSDKAGERFKLSIGTIEKSNNPSSRNLLFLNRVRRRQKIHGWGGSFTDSTGINMKLLSVESQHQIMRAYFGQDGGRYNLARVPIGGTDFSTRGYTYNDVQGDIKLTSFSLQKEDLQYKIPMIREALSMNQGIKFVAAAWTAPTWMKMTNSLEDYGFLNPKHYQTYANYLIKFLDEYKKYGISFWSVSTGNEPTYLPTYYMVGNSMSWTPHSVNKWIVENLGPSLARSQHRNTEIQALDDQRSFLPHHPQIMFKNEQVKKAVTSIGLHWYSDFEVDPNVLDQTHYLFPDKPLLMTETCVGYLPTDIPKVMLGSWERAEIYFLKMIENVNHWVVGWIDWNLVLDVNGGPNWIRNFVDAPIIVNPENNEFFKQPLYYSMVHFSRFVPRNSVVVQISSTRQVVSTAFLTPQYETVIVLCNKSDHEADVKIVDFSSVISVTLSPRSFHTIVF